MAATPQFTLTATLEDITGQPAGSTPNPARLEIMLCNFGLYLPAIVGNANLTELGPKPFPSTGAQLVIPLWGNDLISPAGTYYAITVIDGNENVVQCGAYEIVGAGTFDLSTLKPLFPIQPPPGPPAIVSELEIVPYSANLVFHANTYLAFKVTLSGSPSLATSTINGGVPGNLYTFCILQDGAGGHAFLWPANIENPPDVNTAPNATTIATFLCDDLDNFVAAGGGTQYDPSA